jgi:hypothetical protein
MSVSPSDSYFLEWHILHQIDWFNCLDSPIDSSRCTICIGKVFLVTAQYLLSGYSDIGPLLLDIVLIKPISLQFLCEAAHNKARKLIQGNKEMD